MGLPRVKYDLATKPYYYVQLCSITIVFNSVETVNYALLYVCVCVCVCVFKNIYFKQTHIKIVFLVKGQSQYVNDVMRHKFKVSFYTC